MGTAVRTQNCNNREKQKNFHNKTNSYFLTALFVVVVVVVGLSIFTLEHELSKDVTACPKLLFIVLFARLAP